MAIRYLDFEGGNDANDATSFAQRVKSFTGLTAKLSAGDTVRIMKSIDPTALGTCTWTNASRVLTIPSGTIKDIDSCDAAWTASTNVTTTTTGTRKQGTNANSVAIAAGFTTGLVAYKALAGATDFSGFQQINFWVQANATVAASVFRIDLCSDAAGATPVNSFTVTVALNPINSWNSIVMDNGSALGSSIQSIAITALSDPGTVTLIIDNFFVSKAPGAADCLTLNSLVRKTTPVADVDFWFNVLSVAGTSAEIGGNIGALIATARLYTGITESVATQVRQTIQQTVVTNSTTVVNQPPAPDGTLAAPVTYSGGWDRSAMTTRDGETWLGVCNGNGIGVATVGRSYLYFTDIHCAGFASGWSLQGTWNKATDCGSYSSSVHAWILNSNTQGRGNQYVRCLAVGFGQIGFQVTSGNPGQHLYDSCISYGSTTTSVTTGFGFSMSGCDSILRNCRSLNHGYVGYDVPITDQHSISLDGCYAANNASGSIRVNAGGGEVSTRNFTTADAVPFVSVSNAQSTRLICNRFGANADDHRVYGFQFTMTTETSTNRRTASGYAYKLLLTGTSRSVIDDRVKLPLGRFFVRAGQTFTYTLWVNRNNTGLNVRLGIPGGMDASILTDVVSTAASGAISGYNDQLTISVTPTADLEVPVYLEVWGSNTQFVYFDDSSQAWT